MTTIITFAWFFYFWLRERVLTALEYTMFLVALCQINQWNFKREKKKRKKMQLIHHNGFQLEPQISRQFFFLFENGMLPSIINMLFVLDL